MYTLEQYQTLCNAIAQGALIVMYGDKQVHYRSLSDMIAIKKLMEQELGLNTDKPTVTTGIYNKGIN